MRRFVRCSSSWHSVLPRRASQRHSTNLQPVVTQLGIPSTVTPAEIARKRSLGDAISLCAEAAGFEPKQLQDALKLDKAQWSRWTDGKEGILWPKLCAVMDKCGNDAPVLWMLHAREYDLGSLRHRETELERQLREAREENVALRRVLRERSV